MKTPSRPSRVKHPVRLRREISYTMLYVFSHSPEGSGAAAPAMEPAIRYALDSVRNLVGVIDWVKVAAFKPNELGIPEWLPCGARFVTSLNLDPAVDADLHVFRDAIAPDFDQLIARGVYLNFAVAVLFRAVIAQNLGKLPYKVADDAELSEDAPATFNPSELLSAGASRAADPARKKHMTFARIDPSIFDQSDLFPNGKVDAEGFADTSELF